MTETVGSKKDICAQDSEGVIDNVKVHAFQKQDGVGCVHVSLGT